MGNIFSIKNRLVLFFLIIILGLVSVVGGIIYKISTDVIENEANASIINNLQNASDNIDIILRSLNYLTAEILMNTDIYENISQNPQEGSYEYYSNNRAITDVLDKIRYSNSTINSVYLYSVANSNLYKTDMSRTIKKDEVIASSWYKAAISWPNMTWGVVKSLENSYVEPRNLIATFKTIGGINQEGAIGYFSVNIDERDLKYYLDRIKPGKTGIVYVVNSEGIILSHNNSQLIGTKINNPMHPEKLTDKSGYFIYEKDKKRILLSYINTGYSGWKYIGEVPLDEILGSISRIKEMVLLICIIASILAFGVAFAMSKSVFSPVEKLVMYMKKAEDGDLSIQIAEKRRDEFGLLFESFNSMISKMKSLIEEVYIQRLLKKEIQLKMVQSQINSHFLYNTLDSIHWAARGGENDVVCSMTKELSSYFRKFLSEGKDIITIREAYELVNSYLLLQSVRFVDRFDFTIEADEDILECHVLKYLFQPIVENAIYHGVEKIRQKGHVQVKWTNIDDKNIEFAVSDSGVGMRPEKMEEINKLLDGEEYLGEGNFALKNLNSQLKLFYGQDYKISILSEYGKGTKVSITIPIQR